MTTLTWDQVGDRRYETGLDRGVLYLPNGTAVPWNGLVSITEDIDREVKSYYLDGIKYLDHHVPSSYSAKLGAYTYPDELDELLGVSQFVPGVFIHDQRTRLFNLCYRTLEGNDLKGVDAAYKIHLVYNVLAIPSSVARDTLSDSPSVALFEWSLSGTPAQMFGIRPTSHISLHSRSIDPAKLAEVEAILYGTNGDLDVDPVVPPTAPALPDLVTFLAMFDISEEGG
jgi:hypothetical protein